MATQIYNNTPVAVPYGNPDDYYEYYIAVPEGTSTLDVTTASEDYGDCDLYMALTYYPDPGSNDYASENAGCNESIHIDNPDAGSWKITVYGYSGFSNVTLLAVINGAPAPATAPDATTYPADGITATGATLYGEVTTNGAETTVTFEYGTSPSYGSTATAAQSPVADPATRVAVSAALTGLTAGTTYHFRVKAVNSAGTTYGADATFVPAAPTTVLFRDTFVGAARTHLLDHTPDTANGAWMACMSPNPNTTSAAAWPVLQPASGQDAVQLDGLGNARLYATMSDSEYDRIVTSYVPETSSYYIEVDYVFASDGNSSMYLELAFALGAHPTLNGWNYVVWPAATWHLWLDRVSNTSIVMNWCQVQSKINNNQDGGWIAGNDGGSHKNDKHQYYKSPSAVIDCPTANLLTLRVEVRDRALTFFINGVEINAALGGYWYEDFSPYNHVDSIALSETAPGPTISGISQRSFNTANAPDGADYSFGSGNWYSRYEIGAIVVPTAFWTAKVSTTETVE